ncbi:MAG: nucleotidyltransferase family protein [Thermomicrobiales bacterium]
MRQETSGAIVFPATIAGQRARLLLDAVLVWVEKQPDIVSAALFGSWVAGAARPDSDIDLLIVAHDSAGYFAWQDWLSDFGKPGDRVQERIAGLPALRVWYADGPETEFVFAAPADLAASEPAKLLASPLLIIHDPAGVLAGVIHDAP